MNKYTFLLYLVAGRGAQEVGSSLKLFFEKYLHPDVEDLLVEFMRRSEPQYQNCVALKSYS